MFKKKNHLLMGILLIGIALLIIYSCLAQPILKEIIVLIISLVGAIAVFLQIRKSTSATTGEFILNLQQVYTNNTEFVELYLKCWDEYNIKQEIVDIKKQKRIIVNYLTFFESIYIMLAEGCISIELIDELFARRFFVVVNNKKIQDEELLKDQNYKYYLNIYRLYYIWKKHRVEQKESDPEYTDMLIDFHNDNYEDLLNRLKEEKSMCIHMESGKLQEVKKGELL